MDTTTGTPFLPLAVCNIMTRHSSMIAHLKQALVSSGIGLRRSCSTKSTDLNRLDVHCSSCTQTFFISVLVLTSFFMFFKQSVGSEIPVSHFTYFNLRFHEINEILKCEFFYFHFFLAHSNFRLFGIRASMSGIRSTPYS